MATEALPVRNATKTEEKTSLFSKRTVRFLERYHPWPWYCEEWWPVPLFTILYPQLCAMYRIPVTKCSQLTMLTGQTVWVLSPLQKRLIILQRLCMKSCHLILQRRLATRIHFGWHQSWTLPSNKAQGSQRVSKMRKEIGGLGLNSKQSSHGAQGSQKLIRNLQPEHTSTATEANHEYFSKLGKKLCNLHMGLKSYWSD